RARPTARPAAPITATTDAV
ncbi:hypothetical protein D018_4515B, partial [Vibrio parahaemolyticus VP2007-007]